MAVERVLDLDRADVLAARDDDVLAAIPDLGVAVGLENGEIAGAVNNFRFNMSPLDLLKQASDVGRTEPALSREWSDWFTRSAMPPMVVEGFNMSSVSQAQ